jgi:hypothetical protein
MAGERLRAQNWIIALSGYSYESLPQRLSPIRGFDFYDFICLYKRVRNTHKTKRPSDAVEEPLCPRLDSNQHAVSSATTSRWCVYQFRHPGKELVLNYQLVNLQLKKLQQIVNCYPSKRLQIYLFFQNNSKSCSFRYFRMFNR